MPSALRRFRPSRGPGPRRAAALLALAALVASACGGSRTASSPPRRPGPEPPSILLIVVDTLRADHLGVYGFDGNVSPHIDALASRGVRFERYTTVVPTTLSSFTSMLTGRYPHTHGVFRNGVRWPDGLEGMQTEFRKAGYETAAFVSSYSLTSRFGISRGFEHFDEHLTVAMDLAQNTVVRTATEVTNATISWLEGRRGNGRPFFAMVHYFDPHWPYQPPAPYDAMFDPGYAGPVHGSMADLQAGRRVLMRSKGALDADTRHLEALYAGEVRYTDDQIGRLLDAVARLASAPGTLVVLTADHGETLHEHDDYFDHGPSVYDTEIRIPLIVAGPGIEGAGRVVAQPACNIDLAPTLLAYAGIAVPEAYEGRSFLDALRSDEPPATSSNRALFAEATKPFNVERNQRWPNRLKARCVLLGTWKVIQTPWRGDQWELYDLATDPGEQHDLWGAAAAPRKEVDAMAVALSRWSAVAPAVPGTHAPTDPEVLERLRSLGYVQ